uniref:Glycosyltransferase n=1 Tax=Strongyloides venezuelensis TaxID=75913 RepID=A0A0K0FUG1_STRVS
MSLMVWRAGFPASLAQGQSVCLVNRRSLVRFQHEASSFSAFMGIFEVISFNYKVGIFVVYQNSSYIKDDEFNFSKENILSYGSKHGYDVNLVSEESFFETKRYCPHYDFNFRRFCILSEILRLPQFYKKYDYVLMLDQNMVVINSSTKLESFIPNDQNIDMQLFNNPKTLEFESKIIFFKHTFCTVCFIASLADYFYIINSNSNYLLNIDSAIWNLIIIFSEDICKYKNNNKEIKLLHYLQICMSKSSSLRKYYSYSNQDTKFIYLMCLKQVFFNTRNEEPLQSRLYGYTTHIKINETITLSNFFKSLKIDLHSNNSKTIHSKIHDNVLIKKPSEYNQYFDNFTKLNVESNFIKSYNEDNIYHSLNLSNVEWDKLDDHRYNIYIKSAFLISNDSIRLSILKNINDNRQLYYRLPNSPTELKNYEKVVLNCQSGSCIEKRLNLCTTVGYVGKIYKKNLFSLLNSERKIYLTKDLLEINDVEIELIDSRKNMQKDGKTLYKHILGICIQPMYLYYDYPTVIRFFENWILEGVTKFYLYHQSSFDKIFEIIKAYRLKSNIDIEVIDWSKLPYNKENREFNPNTEIYRLEAPLAIYDCMQRARNHIKFVVSTDLDEIIHVNKKIANGNLISLLERESNKYPDSALFSFQSRRGYIPMNWGVGNPKNIDFSVFSNLLMDKDFFKRPLYQKNIYRPERVVSYQIHLIRSLERNPLTNHKYTYTLIPPSSAFIFHLRRFKDYFFLNTKKIQATLLEEKSKKWNRNFKSRLSQLNFTDNDWLTNIHHIGLELENCRKRVARTMGAIICQSIEVCEKKLKVINNNRIIKANNSWIVI